jgi:hypothetical protein
MISGECTIFGDSSVIMIFYYHIFFGVSFIVSYGFYIVLTASMCYGGLNISYVLKLLLYECLFDT